MTDSTGMFQHATYTIPNFAEGYCTDDNARALLLTVLLEELGQERGRRSTGSPRPTRRSSRRPSTASAKRFRNFLGFDRRWLEEVGSEDCHGRALWALGACVGRSRRPDLPSWAAAHFELALPPVAGDDLAPGLGVRPAGHPRVPPPVRRRPARRPGPRHADGPADRALRRHGHARLALVRGDPDLRQRPAAAGPDRQRPRRRRRRGPWRSACRPWAGWSRSADSPRRATSGRSAATASTARGGEPARFDQQPIEANATVSACLEAYRATEDPAWLNEARSAFEWFLGRNDLGQELYDPSTGGCCDGLQEDRINRNQGAESTLAFLLSLAEMNLLESSLAAFRQVSGRSSVTPRHGSGPTAIVLARRGR